MEERKMRKMLFALCVLLILPMIYMTLLNAGEVREVFPEKPHVGDEYRPIIPGDGGEKGIPSPPRTFQVGTIVDSTMMDHQSNATIHTRIATISTTGLHASAMISPDEAFLTRGMKYFYYDSGVFTNAGYIEGNGVGNQRGGYGMVTNYNVPDLGIGDIAVISSHTNLSGQTYGSHWYHFQDAFQGLGAFSPVEGPVGDGVSACDDFLWPSINIANDLTGNMCMVATTNASACEGGFDDIHYTFKTYADLAWSEGVNLHAMDDPTAWVSGPNIPMMAGGDDGLLGVVSADFGGNTFYWESTDGGATFGDRVNLVVWTEYQAQGDADSIYTPGVSSIWQFRTKMKHWDPVNGITTVYRHPDGISNFAGGTAFAYNVGHPAVGFGETDDIVFVVYEGFLDADQDPTNQIYFGDIYVSLSTDGGATWKDRVNVTSSVGSDDLYPSIARINPQGIVQDLDGFSVGDADGVNDFALIYQNDDVAGTFLRGEETTANWDMILIAPVDFDLIEGTSGIGDNDTKGGDVPRATALTQNYPNPFNPQTTIRYSLNQDTNVRLTIHNLRGEIVKTLVNEGQPSGEYNVAWDGRNSRGETVSSGIYFYRLNLSDGTSVTKKMVLLK
jgi:hypothetical protein